VNSAIDRQAVQAAVRSFPAITGASVLHVHVGADGNFLLGGRPVPPRQYWTDVVSGLGLPDGQPLIMVGCGGPSRAGTLEQAAAGLARHACQWVLAAGSDLHITAGGMLARVGFDSLGRPSAAPGSVALIAPDGQVRGALGPDLAEAVWDPQLTVVTRKAGRVIRWAVGVET
jgi:hypothetical protein